MKPQSPNKASSTPRSLRATLCAATAATLLTGSTCLVSSVLTSATCCAEEAFYKQLIKTTQPANYSPTRSFVIITDAEHGNQLVAEDDPQLQFNQAWMQQYQTGYHERLGGAAFGEIARSYLRNAYKALRAEHAQSFSALPDENGAVRSHSLTGDMEYHLNYTGRNMELGVKYAF